MKPRFLNSIRLSVVMVAVWLLLVGELSVAHALLAILLALLVPMFTDRLRERRGMPGKPMVMARLALVVLRDIVVSNIQVARLILGPQSRIRPGFVWIPLELGNTYGITALASIITMTPGTLSCDLTPDRRYLLVHCLNLEDAEGTVAQIKQSYERPLLEIFPT
ncbi:Na+/H+ antiporter subunit E [Pseudomarimonas salicorniae]|uniref:Na+/H+ antiporter subunit E n=1 Tax=Pseudomarimonas salicorniae TaxID=2933270 RepID=A0ABT0GKN3_9GAMM|nr:Na+/H+ antiporter subunit E [Lysobacter sp. CAU 1642]